MTAPAKDSATRLRQRKRVVTNMINKYGLDSVELFLEEMHDPNKSAADSARRMDVSGSQANLWANILGRRTTIYLVHPEITAISKERGRR